ncbi:TPA: HNH endonuclease family protein, partial [Vibrio cholerae O1]
KLKSDDGVSAEAMGDYLYRQVQWVNNIVPTQMDLNRLFATMNTAGIQLEQADILKAKLFKHIHTDKAQYDAMWVACEHLENYFERNVRKVFPNADWYHIEPEHLASFDAERFAAKDETSEALSGLSIAELASQVKASSIPDNTEQEKFETYDLDVETVYCRPIIKFPLLLIHAYRVYLALNDHNDIEPRLHSDRLLEIFDPLINGDEQSVKLFIETLWQVRYQFDRWVVKWVERDDATDAQLGLTYQSRSKSNDTYYINRTQKELTDIVLLQSVRNFTGERSAQYWLTPFLSGLIRSSIKQDSVALELLENIDNKMSLSVDTQKEASFALAEGIEPNCQSWQSQSTYFAKSLGTSFEHYWFQKLEYLIWKKMKASESSLPSEELNKFKKYRITSKNSVEHVHPQNDEYNSRLDCETLNSFGNLVLLSPGENSSYSNQDVDKKRIDFERKSHFDALKLREIFGVKGQGLWGKQQIDNHLEDMMAVFAQHYKHQ